MVAKRLYYDACYQTKFVGIVTSYRDGKKAGEGLVTLDQTCFYPTSGGQPNDTGVLGGFEVYDVEKADDEEIIHHVRGEGLPESFIVGQEITGEVNWDRRFDHMQQHTGQHLLSALLFKHYNVDTTSVHIGSDLSTFDLDKVFDDRETLRNLETLHSDMVFANHPITISYRSPTEEEAKTKHGDIRIISIAGPDGINLDENPCCGTHLNTTGQIGPVLFLGTQKVRGGTRLTYALGKRTVRVMQEHNLALYDLNKLLKNAPSRMAGAVDQLVKTNKQLTKERAQLISDLGEMKMRNAFSKVADKLSDTDQPIVLTIVQDSVDDLEAAMAKTAPLLPRCVFIACSTKPPFKVILGSNPGGADEAIKKLNKQFEGRGGGSKTLASCSLASSVSAQDVLKALLGHDAPLTTHHVEA